MEKENKGKRWTVQEENRLIKQIEARPQNLQYCFTIVAEELGRTTTGVAAHWYAKTSKDSKRICFFTASKNRVSKNRKNGEGEAAPRTLWDKMISLIKSYIQ